MKPATRALYDRLRAQFTEDDAIGDLFVAAMTLAIDAAVFSSIGGAAINVDVVVASVRRQWAETMAAAILASDEAVERMELDS